MRRMMTGLAATLMLVMAGFALWSAWGAHRIEQQYPPLGNFVTVDGLRLHVRDMGQGAATPVVLLHGASSNLRDFARIQPRLAQNGRVLAFDRPGYGYSQRPDGDWPDPAEQARLVLDAAAQLGVERPLLVGHSWAGSAVMAAMVEMPERIAGGVLLAGAAGHWAGPVNWTYSVAAIPVLGPLFARTVVYPAGTRMLGDVVQEVLAPNPVPEDYIRTIGAPLALRPGSFLHNAEDMNRLSVYLQRLSPRYREIDKPLLLVHGADDELVPFWNHGERLLPVIEQAQVEMLPDTGHAPHHARPDAVMEAITRFEQERVRSR